jgi:hypothetical protein
MVGAWAPAGAKQPEFWPNERLLTFALPRSKG